jgi:hypothetical protein
MKMIANDRCAQFLIQVKTLFALKKFSHDFSPQPPIITLPGFSIKGVVGKYLFHVEFPSGQNPRS